MATFTALLLVGLISYIVYLDAEALRKLNAELYQQELKAQPASWGVLSFLLMIVTVPVYLFLRFRFFRKAAAVTDQSSLAPAASDGSRELVRATGIVIVWFLLLQIYSIVIYPSLLSFTQPKINLPQGLHLNIAGVILFIGTVLLLKDRKTDLRRALYLTSDRPGKRGGLWLSVLCGVALASLVYLIQRTRAVIPSTPMVTALQSSTPTVLAQFLILAALIAPLYEEVFYRGFVFDVLEKTKGKTRAFGVVTAAFAVAHLAQISGDWMMMGMIVLVACCLTYIRMSSSTVVPSALAHYSYNICLFLIPMLVLFATNPSYAKFTFLRDRLPVETRISLLKQSIAEQPKQWAAYNSLAWLLVKEDRELPEALRLIDIGLSGSPDNLSYLDTKAEILFKLGRLDEAVAVEKKLTEKAPEDRHFKEQFLKFQKAWEERKTRMEEPPTQKKER